MLTAFSCTEYNPQEFTVEKPESIAAKEYLNAYDVLKTYINRTENPNFQLGSIINLADFESKNTVYRIIHSNFDEIAFPGTELFHDAVVDDDGKININTVNGLIGSVKESGISMFGHALCANTNQNSVYLNKMLAPQVFMPEKNALDKSGLSESPFTGGWSEAHVTSGGSVSITNNGIAGGSSSITLINGNNTTSASTRIQPPYIDRTQAIKKWLVTFCIKSNRVGRGRITLSNNFLNRYPFTLDENEGATSIFNTTDEWKQFSFVLDADISKLNTRDTMGFTFSIDVGYIRDVTYQIDLQTLSMIPVEGDDIPEYTAFRVLDDTEKVEALKDALQGYVSTMMDTCRNVVKAWDVVSNPMSEKNLGEIKYGSDLLVVPAGEFYWQDYLGKDYAVTAFNMARLHGNKNEKLFIYDNNLFEIPAKCDGLVEYIKYIDGKGATVDGISTPLSVTLNRTDMESVKDFFGKLAATGKLVRISDLTVEMRREGGSANLNASDLTEDEQKAMSNFYKEIVAAYFEKVPAQQRYGIMLHSPVDNARSIGLWSAAYSRKHAYAGFIEGIGN
jgi:Beta-1,4-xylanase